MSRYYDKIFGKNRCFWSCKMMFSFEVISIHFKDNGILSDTYFTHTSFKVWDFEEIQMDSEFGFVDKPEF